MLDHLIPLHRQNEDVIVHLIKFLILLRPHLRVNVPQQDQILEEDDVGNTNVELELRPVLISPYFDLLLGLSDDVLEVGALEDALAGPADLSQAALAHVIAAEELVLGRQVQQRWQDFDVEGVIAVDLGLLEAVDPEDALHAESVVLEELLEERPGAQKVLVGLLVAPEFLRQFVVLILHYFSFIITNKHHISRKLSFHLTYLCCHPIGMSQKQFFILYLTVVIFITSDKFPPVHQKL